MLPRHPNARLSSPAVSKHFPTISTFSSPLLRFSCNLHNTTLPDRSPACHHPGRFSYLHFSVSAFSSQPCAAFSSSHPCPPIVRHPPAYSRSYSTEAHCLARSPRAAVCLFRGLSRNRSREDSCPCSRPAESCLRPYSLDCDAPQQVIYSLLGSKENATSFPHRTQFRHLYHLCCCSSSCTSAQKGRVWLLLLEFFSGPRKPSFTLSQPSDSFPLRSISGIVPTHTLAAPLYLYSILAPLSNKSFITAGLISTNLPVLSFTHIPCFLVSSSVFPITNCV